MNIIFIKNRLPLTTNPGVLFLDEDLKRIKVVDENVGVLGEIQRALSKELQVLLSSGPWTSHRR